MPLKYDRWVDDEQWMATTLPDTVGIIWGMSLGRCIV